MYPTKRAALAAGSVLCLLGFLLYHSQTIQRRALQSWTQGLTVPDLRHVPEPGEERANAAFVMLVRNSDLGPVLNTIEQIESRFNRRYHYPYVFLNDVPFEDNFIRLTSAVTSGNTSYGLVPASDWLEPDWIDQSKAAEARQKMSQDNVIYGGSEAYRRMCRYESGFFFRHPLVQPYEYYWRFDPGIKFFCDIDYDPFMFMKQNDKKYGFTITIKEYEKTIPTLWDTTKAFMREHPEYIAKDNSMYWISENEGETYNLCHFWSNFEIGSLEFLRSKAYLDYFEYLDKSGGFSYERWGDAPVHSIAAALFLNTTDIHFFQDMGYRHEPFQHCPKNADVSGKCFCDPEDSFETHWYSCTPRWHEFLKRKGLE